jgi:steroid delta-isomerase
VPLQASWTPTPLRTPLPRTGVSNDPVGAPAQAGRDAIRKFFEGMGSATEQVTIKPDHIFIAGDSAAFKWTAQLTAKHGQSVSFEGIDVIRVNDEGKIQTLHAYWDPAPVLAVLRG